MFDSIGRSVGFQVGEKQITPANSYRDLKVPHFKDQKRVSPEYISISEGGKDGICVAQVDITVSFFLALHSLWTLWLSQVLCLSQALCLS